MKKVFAVALAMTVAVGMLAGCGSNDSAQGGSALKKKTTQVKKSTTPQTQRKSQTAQPL